MAGVSSGPTPWWQLPENRGSLPNLQSSAPSGYEYDPVQMRYARTPTSAGQRVNEFESAAMPGAFGAAMTGLQTAAGGVGGVGGGAVGAGGGASAGGGSYVPPIAAPNMKGANDAAYASAKDKVGNAARGALTSLNDELGATGMMGSGAQVKGTEDVINAGQSQLGDVARGQAVNEAALGADAAKTGYTGAIAQRGQDVQAQEAQGRLALESRQQYMQLLQSALSGLGNAGSLY